MLSKTYTISRDEFYRKCRELKDPYYYYDVESVIEGCLPQQIQDAFGTWDSTFEIKVTVTFPDDNNLHTLLN